MKYKFEDINIGDEVYFDSTKSQNNYDLNWKVIYKLEPTRGLIVQLNEMGHTDKRCTIGIDEVKHHFKYSDKR